MYKIIITSTSLLNDRIILNNDFLPELSEKSEVHIWATAAASAAFKEVTFSNVAIEPFPEVKPMRFAFQILRRINDYAWDAKGLSFSRQSFWKHSRLGTLPAYHRPLRKIAGFLCKIGLEMPIERISERVYLSENRSPEAEVRFKQINPDILVCMSPFRMDEPGIVSTAKRNGIRVMAFITSWDNITTKGRFMFDYDGFIVWSEKMKQELHTFYPRSRKKPVYIVGAPQYDVFFNPEYHLTREEFLRPMGFDPGKPVVLYTLGSPNLFNEYPGAFEFLKLASKGSMGEIQVIVRPHPLFNNDERLDSLKEVYSRVYIQKPNPPKNLAGAFTHEKDKIIDWVNTYKHADVVINLASTVTVDASFFDRPVINIDFDPSGEKNELVSDVNHRMNHFRPITESGGMWDAKDYEEIVKAVNGYLADPSIHRDGRKRIVEYVCQFSDGKSGLRFADSIIDFLNTQLQKQG